jgi:hypothetical protein
MANVPNTVQTIGDKISTTLTASISASDTTITVNSGAGMNPNGGYIIIDPNTSTEEIVYIESVSGNTLTVASNGRGRGATIATSHNVGAVVTDIITNEMFNRPRTAFVAEHNDNGTHKLETNTFDNFISAAGLISGKITASTASNNLLVSIVYADGSTPSSTNPVRVMINNTVRRITSSLSVTVSGGSNNFDTDSLGTNKTLNLFIFAFWSSADQKIGIGVSRANLGSLYSDYSNSSSNARYMATGGAAVSSSDVFVNIGKFAVTMTGQNYTGVSRIQQGSNLEISEKFNYSPTVTGSGSMTITSLSINNATYQINGQLVSVQADLSFTTGGTASSAVRISLPIPAVLAGGRIIGVTQYVGGGSNAPNYTCSIINSTPTLAIIERDTGANFTLGSSFARINITYPIV